MGMKKMTALKRAREGEGDEKRVTTAQGESSADLIWIQQGKRMAEILEEIAADGGVAEIADPLAWEREIRQDRPLPGRES